MPARFYPSALFLLALPVVSCADAEPSYRDDRAWRDHAPELAIYDYDFYDRSPADVGRPYYYAPAPAIASAPRVIRPPEWRGDDRRRRDRGPAQGAHAPSQRQDAPRHWDARERGAAASNRDDRDTHRSGPAAERDRRSAPPGIATAPPPQRPNSRPPRSRRDDGHGS